MWKAASRSGTSDSVDLNLRKHGRFSSNPDFIMYRYILSEMRLCFQWMCVKRNSMVMYHEYYGVGLDARIIIILKKGHDNMRLKMGKNGPKTRVILCTV